MRSGAHTALRCGEGLTLVGYSVGDIGVQGGLIGRIMCDAAPFELGSILDRDLALAARPALPSNLAWSGHGHSVGSARDGQLAIRLTIETIIDPPVFKGIGRFLRGRSRSAYHPAFPMDPHQWVDPYVRQRAFGSRSVRDGGS